MCFTVSLGVNDQIIYICSVGVVGEQTVSDLGYSTASVGCWQYELIFEPIPSFDLCVLRALRLVAGSPFRLYILIIFSTVPTLLWCSTGLCPFAYPISHFYQ